MSSAAPRESRLVKFMSKFSDLVVLNFCHVVCCLPVVTIGAATKALYTVMFAADTEKDDKVSKMYLSAFKKNFKQTTLLWLLVFALCFASIFNLYYFYSQPAPLHYLFIVFPLLSFLSLILLSYIFPLLSQFNLSSKDAIRNSFIFGIGFLPRTFVIVLLNSLPLIAVLIHPMLFVLLVPVWVLFYFSVTCMLNVKLLRGLFEKYTPQVTA